MVYESDGASAITTARPYRSVRIKTKPLVPSRPKKSKKRTFSDYCADSNETSDGNLHHESEDSEDRQLTAWIKTSRTGKHVASKQNDDRALSAYEADNDARALNDVSLGTQPLKADSEHKLKESSVQKSTSTSRSENRRTDDESGRRPYVFRQETDLQEQSVNFRPNDSNGVNVAAVPAVTASDSEDELIASAAKARAEQAPKVKAMLPGSTPRGPRSMKKVLVGGATDDDEDDLINDSPSKRASTRLPGQKAIADSVTRRQLFSEDKGLDVPPSPVQRQAVADASSPKSVAIRPDRSQSTLTKSKQSGNSTDKKATLTTIPTLNVSPEHVRALQYNIMSKLTMKRQLPLQFRDAQYTDVHTLLRETIIRAESNSALLLGPPSTGKSLLVDNALQSFKAVGHEFLVVRLDGMIQTDDRMALKAIAKQLQPANEEIANADIMTALLAILSNPRDFGENEDPLSTIILLDHFEQFTEQPRQTLLYNLFDIAQSKKAPICVLGLTTRVNSYDALEKRVKSRFSHRVIQFPHLDAEQFRSLSLAALSCDMMQSHDDDDDQGGLAAYTRTWNDFISTSQPLDTFITLTYLTSTNIRSLFTTLIPHIALLGTSDLYFAFPDFSALLQKSSIQMIHSQPPDSKLSLLPDLSLLELAILISAARLEIKSGRINLMTTIDEHTSLVQKSAISQRSTGVTTLRSASRALCTIAWQRLLDVGLIMPQGGRSGGSGNAEFRVVKVEVRLEEISGLVKADRVRIGPWMNSWLTLG